MDSASPAAAASTPLHSLSRAWTNLLESSIEWAPRATLALVVLALTFALARIIARHGKRVTRRIIRDDEQIAGVVATVLRGLTWVAGTFLALEIAGLEAMLVKVIAGAGVLGIVIGFAVKDIAANGLAGILLNAQRPFKVGDWVDIGGSYGKVSQIGPITTTIRNVYGQDVYVPNQTIYASSFVNYSGCGKRLVVLKIGVSYGDDLAKVQSATLDELRQIEQRVQSEPIDFFFTEIGSSTYNFEARLWIHFKEQKDYLRAKSTMITRIKTRFEREDFSIAYNVLTLDFAVKGGTNLFDKDIQTRTTSVTRS